MSRRGERGEEGAPRDPAGAGADLRRAREARGLSVAEVANEIRVSARHIRAIEEGRLEALPEGPYRRGFVEAYAAFVGLAPGETVSHLEDRPRGEAGGRTVFRYAARRPFNWRDWTLPIAFTLVLSAFGIVRAVGGDEPRALPEPPPLPAAPPPPPAPALAREERPTTPAPAEDAGEEPPVGTGVRVLLRSEGTTWVLAAADGGAEVRHEIGPGENLELAARERLGLTIGDAGLVRVSHGGRELGFVGERGETRGGMLFTARTAPSPPTPPRTVRD